MKEIIFKTIGIIHSAHTDTNKIPIQPAFADGCKGYVEIFDEYLEGLKDIEGFSHIYLIYQWHERKHEKLIVKPFLENNKRGVFATRSPSRPNAIGLSIVPLISREKNILHLDNLDVLNGTPLIDIKPYTKKFDHVETTKNGWQDSIGIDGEEAYKLGARHL